MYNEFNNVNCTGNGVITVYKPNVCIPGQRHSYACESTCICVILFDMCV